MSLKTLNIKKAYSSDFDDILYDFYIPALKESIEYNRLAGFFSSTSLATSARGISGLIKNGGSIKLIVSPKLNKNDVEIILNSCEEPEKYIEKRMLEELEELENRFIKDHVFALGWMIANKKLEIKVAIAFDNEKKLLSYEDILNSGLFHQKVGILKDAEGNTITFSGSVNETAAGWSGNIEEFKVFRSWISDEIDYLASDVSKFDKFWNNKSDRIKIVDIPHAVKRKIVQIAPDNFDEIYLEKWYKSKKKSIELFDHQKDAIRKWISNEMIGLFEMATGTGKTFAALGCINEVLKTIKHIAIVITCPYHHLIEQWKKEIDKFGINYDVIQIADSSSPLWKDKLMDELINISLDYKKILIILTTHNTFSSDDFIKIVNNEKWIFNLCLIADEVHNIGAEKRRIGLIEKYKQRLGLSATPSRWFDEMGTYELYNYFRKIVFNFDLEQAINTENPLTGETYLTPYRYIPKFVSLTSSELENYINETKKISRSFILSKDDKEKNEILKKIIFKRADIVKNALEKYASLIQVLDNLQSPINHTLIYCTPQQKNEILRILKERKLIIHQFTEEEETKPDRRFNGVSEREYILKKFAEKKYQILVAMKCLDEGIDIPQAKVAILMASSGNPIQYIQRIGRVIRRSKGKSESVIYDFIVLPSVVELPPELANIEKLIFEKEVKRYKDIAKLAINSAEVLDTIYGMENNI